MSDESLTMPGAPFPRRGLLAAGGVGITSLALPAATAAASGALVGTSGGGGSWVVHPDSVGAALTTVAGTAVMRLTPAQTNQFGFVYYDETVSTSGGLDIRFTLAQWGGSSTAGDGLCFFLLDGATAPASITPGYLGAALGYTGFFWNGSSFSTNSGVPGGLVGVGFDNLGDYETSAVGPSSVTLAGGKAAKLTVRGRRAENYTVLATQLMGGVGGWPGATTGSTFSSASMRVRITVTSSSRIRVHYEGPGDTSTPFTALTQRLDLSTNVLDGVSSVRFGFAAGTGTVFQNHDIHDDVEIFPFAG